MDPVDPFNYSAGGGAIGDLARAMSSPIDAMMKIHRMQQESNEKERGAQEERIEALENRVAELEAKLSLLMEED